MVGGTEVLGRKLLQYHSLHHITRHRIKLESLLWEAGCYQPEIMTISSMNYLYSIKNARAVFEKSALHVLGHISRALKFGSEMFSFIGLQPRTGQNLEHLKGTQLPEQLSSSSGSSEVHIHMYVPTNIHIHIHKYLRTNIHMYMHTYMYIHTYVPMRIYIYIYIYIYIT
jgi:hypothetical protein